MSAVAQNMGDYTMCVSDEYVYFLPLNWTPGSDYTEASRRAAAVLVIETKTGRVVKSRHTMTTPNEGVRLKGGASPGEAYLLGLLTGLLQDNNLPTAVAHPADGQIIVTKAERSYEITVREVSRP